MNRPRQCRVCGKGIWVILAGLALAMGLGVCAGCADNGDITAVAAQYGVSQAADFDADEIEDYLSIWDDSPFE